MNKLVDLGLEVPVLGTQFTSKLESLDFYPYYSRVTPSITTCIQDILHFLIGHSLHHCSLVYKNDYLGRDFSHFFLNYSDSYQVSVEKTIRFSN